MSSVQEDLHLSHTDLSYPECCDHFKALSDFGDASIAMSFHEDTVQHPAVIGDSEEGPEVVSAQDHPCLDQLLTANGDLEEGDTGASCSYAKVVCDTGASCSYIFPDLPQHVEVRPSQTNRKLPLVPSGRFGLGTRNTGLVYCETDGSIRRNSIKFSMVFCNSGRYASGIRN